MAELVLVKLEILLGCDLSGRVLTKGHDAPVVVKLSADSDPLTTTLEHLFEITRICVFGDDHFPFSFHKLLGFVCLFW